MAGLLPPFSFPPVVAHRGASAETPENTLAAFRQAAALGASAVEFDVKLSADAVPVVIHDVTVDRTTTAAGPVAGFTVDQLQHLDAGSWFDSQFAAEGVPTLAAVLAVLGESGLTCNIELKPDPGTAVATTQAALDVAAAVWPGDRTPPLLSSYERDALAHAQEILPQWPRAALVRAADTATWIDYARDLGAVAIHADSGDMDQAVAAKIQAAGFALGVFTVNDVDRARELWHCGVDYVFTDDPGALLAVAGEG